MNSENFNHILEHPSQLQLSDLSLLNEVIEKYPYFQAPRAVLLKCLKEQESYLYNQKLKVTAAYTVDRNVLFDFITSKEFKTTNTLTAENTNNNNTNSETVDTNESSHNEEPENTPTKANIIPNTAEEVTGMTNDEANQIIDPFLFEEKTPEIIEEPVLNVNAPLTFEKDEMHSFSEWLKLASLKPIVREATKETPTPPKKKLIESSLIDNFIKNNPKISPVRKDLPTINLAAQNTAPTEDLMTETLAKVYLAQKNYKKAIQAYKILSLKNPEKSGLFADRIRAIEKLQHNK